MDNILVYVRAESDKSPFPIQPKQGISWRWLHDGVTLEERYEIPIEKNVFQNLRNKCHDMEIDVFLTSSVHRRKKLLLADMDATIIEGETLDELADFIGLKNEIATITSSAMLGEIDFKTALEKRVSLLKDLPISSLEKTLLKTKINAGAKDVVRVMRHFGAKCYLVSGGFTYFTEAIAKECGFSGHHGNKFDIQAGSLTGKVKPPILDKDTKLNLLNHYAQNLGLTLDETMAVGDGANDIPMLMGAGLGVGFYPKPAVREKIINYIIHTDLTSLLYIQGYSWQDIASSRQDFQS